ncbi:carboxylesterase [Lineolata rhizophorae]|uniref:Carboxylic ester hydrolase n=1 Tax=Lineolata rhizophorae TaxID=578093 RepID=A0A6A6PAU9_9PEZI|nr:carboxylesterase [Lineolata rhizophorae]
MAPTIKHASLNAVLKGVSAAAPGLLAFRGIRYGRVKARFAAPEPVDDWNGAEIDCQQYGPRCPQIPVGVGHLLRIPEDHVFAHEPEDEFECLNLDVVVPKEAAGDGSKEANLPVLIWVHGGSQVMTFGSAASKVGDPTKIVADSVSMGKPIIVVSIQYRLNVFAYGDGKGERNLALQDQRLAIDWVVKHIAGFGGDGKNITLMGESAGGIYAHAQVVLNAPIKRVILMSGSLYLSFPLPSARGQAMLDAVEKKLKEKGYASLKEAPAEALVQAQAEANVVSLWLQDGPEFQDWTQRIGQVEELLVGDVEYESVLWRNGIEQMTPEAIVQAFEQAGDAAKDLRKLYHAGTRPTPTKLAALDFVNDWKFALPVRLLERLWKTSGKTAYRYTFDQPNPWQRSARAHHALDLVLLFGGLDADYLAELDPGAAAVGAEMRARWVRFVNGMAPWSPASTAFAFGPLGQCGEIDAGGLAARRRERHLEFLEKVEPAKLNAALGGLVAGRISLLN